MTRQRGSGVPPSTNYIKRRAPSTLGGGPLGNTPSDMATGGGIVDQAGNLPVRPIPADKSTVTSTYDAKPINAATAWGSFSDSSVTFPPPS